MKPVEGRKRIVIEEVQPQVNCGRYPVKRILGDVVTITCAAFGDGHDHVAARVLYRQEGEPRWRIATLAPLGNDLWSASFIVDQLGPWQYTIQAWIDHFDTWCDDLKKRLAAQPDPNNPAPGAQPQDIPLALRSGALLLEQTAARAKGPDAKQLEDIVTSLRWMADQNAALYENPITEEIRALAARYPDLSFVTKFERDLILWVDRERARYSTWYELFPRSASPDPARHGTLNDVAARIPEIAAMGFDVLYMPPIHPIGVAFRKGPNNSVTAQPGDYGSPWAIGAAEGGHKAILPELGTVADFKNLVATAQKNSMELALDIAFQCSPDHPWVKEHPEWFIIRPDGSIQYAENPPKKYQDIYPLNFESPDWRGLWEELHSVFAYWIRHGVHIFRVDNPHTKALPFWEWCIAEIHKDHPEVIFLAEAFTRPHVMYSLAKAGFSQSYTYFTWRTGKDELQQYFEEITKPPVTDFFHPNIWPNTPDILHASLQTGGRPAFMQRFILAATLGANYGIYGPAFELCEGRPAKPNSEEYLDSEKYQLRHWDRSASHSIAPLITTVNKIRRENPALQNDLSLHFHPVDNSQILCYSKSSTKDGIENTILVAINIDPAHEQSGWIELDLKHLGIAHDQVFDVEDLLTGTHYQWNGRSNYVALRPDVMPAHILRVTRK
ncbi:alpha-1,4-glucan--maltose-1-phosphate maltosyltransferase [Granulicella arctica]|uniref:Alpha-1,4-glucan:maltose-1-phosphate maltosyltransferase n=1 Tax=Granulicella arctica TaxID=940613 RepID=A0A7Y9PGD1_9BACT|nr:alpha-1,4-glucan--maltose-1-phosphate maltosyltransferase [Granulicella arctica]NYF79402.1 starch synthase (maltosyl-transferring) [Granulicella arctica]